MSDAINVMVVDDSKFMRMVLSNILIKHGHVVVGEAENGKEAVEMYDKVNPDIVTMDITMPEMEGIEAVNQIIRRNPNARVVMCSAMGQQALVLDAMRAGARDFIVKPFEDEARVLEAINKAIA